MDYKLENLLTPCLYEDVESIVNSTADFDAFKNKTVLITGAGALLGYYLACSLLMCNDINDNNTKVIVTDREENLFKKYGVLNSRDDIDFVISNFYSNLHTEKVDFIIHTDTTVGKDYFVSIENLLNYGKKAGCTDCVMCSHMNIYGDVYNGKSKISESDEGYINLNSTEGAYLQSQRMAELFAKDFCGENDIHYKLARLSDVFGANGIEFQQADKVDERNYVDEKSIAERISEFADEDVDVIKSYCYVTDVAVALLTILSDGTDGETYNVSSNWDTNFKYIAEICEQLFPDITVNISGRRNNISNDYTISPLNSTRQILDNSKLVKIGFAPKVTLAEGIKRTVKIIQENI